MLEKSYKKENDHFTDIDKAGMAYFMPKLLKSQSCPDYSIDHNKQEQNSDDFVVVDKEDITL